MPDDNERDFLAALLLGPPASHVAWERWLRRAEMPAGGPDLAPMLGARLPQLGPSPPPDLHARLNAAVMVEQRRSERITEILQQCQAQLAAAGRPALSIDGPLPTGSAGPLALRHSARLAFLLPGAADAARTAGEFVGTGFATRSSAARLPGRYVLQHQSGLPIHLHGERLPPPFDGFSFGHLAAALSPAGDLCAADRLALALADGVRSGVAGRDLRWLVDAAVLLRSAERRRLTQWLTMEPMGSLLSAALAVVARSVPGLDLSAVPPPVPPRWWILSAAARLRGRRAVLSALIRV